MSEQSYTGFWWEDGAATEQQPGTLTIAADGKAELDLIRGFDLFTGRKEIESGGITFESFDERPIKVLHGVADNKEFTLLGCRSSHVQLNSLTGKPDKQTLRVRRVLIGIHLKDSGQPVFKSCTLQIENMQTWLQQGRPIFRPKFEEGEAQLFISTEKSASFQTHGCSFRTEMTASFRLPQERRNVSTAIGTVASTLYIDSGEPRSDNGFDDLLKAVVDLLTFARNEPCAVIRQTLVHQDPETFHLPMFDDSGEIIVDNDGRPQIEETSEWMEAEVHAQRVFTPDSDIRVPSSSHKFLFTAADMPFEEILPKWLELRQKVQRSTDMLFGLLYGRPRYAETRMLIIAAAAETLSRCLNEDAIPMTPFDFDRLRTRALGAIDPSDRDRFLSAFRNEPNYRDRIHDLARIPYPAAVDAIIPDRDTWANNLRDARHGLAHGLAGRGADINISLLYERTTYLIYLVLMHELGFSDAIQLRAAQSNQYLMDHQQEP